MFSSEQLKIGKGFEMDLGQLYRAYPDPAFTRINALLEVDLLICIDMGIPRVGRIPYVVCVVVLITLQGLPASLQLAVSYFLDQKLSKSQQMSDWADRPLRPAQLHYAALDAHVQITVLDAFLALHPGEGQVIFARVLTPQAMM